MLSCFPSEGPDSTSPPTAPKITFAKDLFIPLHIICVSIIPDAPTNEPQIIRAFPADGFV